MTIEWLTVVVPAEWHDRYIEADAQVWTKFLATQPGYVGKQIWKNPAEPDQLILIVHWQSRKQWKAIDQQRLIATEDRFIKMLGRSFEIIASEEFIPVSN